MMNNRSGRKAKLMWLSLTGLLLLVCLTLGWAQRQRRVTGQESVAGGVANARTKTITLKSGDDLQKALNAAQGGDEIILQAGASYTGPFVLPYKATDSTAYITIRSSAPASALPAAGVRVTPAYAAALPKLLSPGQGQPALRTAPGAHHYRFIGVEIAPVNEAAFVHELVTLGDSGAAQDTAGEIPHHLVFDRCYIHAYAQQSLKRGVTLNSAATEVVNSYVAGFKVVGQEAQAISGWNGPGPFRLVNNYLEAAGENVMFGGASASVANLVPSDIEVRGNHLAKPRSWFRADATYAGTHWTVKNLFELKSARRVTVEGNLFEYIWRDAQAGFAIVLTPADQDGTAPWSTIEDVSFTNNIIRHAASVFNISNSHGPVRRVTIRNNLFADIDGSKWCGEECSSGKFLQVSGAVELTVERNTIIHSGSIASAYGAPTSGFVFINNVIAQNQYGFQGDGRAPGSDSINFYFPNSKIRDNAIIGGEASHYKERNMYPVSWRQLRFVNPDSGDYGLRGDSPLKANGAGGTDIGADYEAIRRAVFGGADERESR